MDMSTQTSIQSVAREVIGEVAPDELDLFASTSQAYFENPKARPDGESMLGFDVGAVVTYLSPIVLIAVTKVIEYARDPAHEALKKGIGGIVTGWIEGLAKKFQRTEPAKIQALTPEQLQRAHKLAIATLAQYNFPKDKRELVASSIVGKLALAE